MPGTPDSEPPAIGTTYNGSKVVDVHIEVTDRGKRTRKRSTITLENGVILKLDHFVDKKFEQLDTKRRRAPPPRTRSAKEALPQRGLPKTKSGRHLPKPSASSGSGTPPMRAESPARGVGRSRSSSRGRDVIVREAPSPSRSSDLSAMAASTRGMPRIPRSPARQSRTLGRDYVDAMSLSPEEPTTKPVSIRDQSPEPSPKRPSSLKNLSNFLVSPKRKAPSYSKSGSDLEAMRCSVHSCDSKSSLAEGKETSRKRGSLKKLGNLIQKTKVGKTRSGDDLSCMQEETKQERSKPMKRRSTATSESNKEKLRSFKDMISPVGKTTKDKDSTEKPRRRATLKDEQLPPSPRKDRRRSSHQTAVPPITPKKERRSVAPQVTESPRPVSPVDREPSLSPPEVKKSPGGSYLTGILDSLYDSYINDDDDGEGSDGDSDCGYGHNSSNLLDMSLNKLVDWAE
ncbi:MAG: hypothetical protein SGILL_006023 [Bacillariaceae sp.]